jgi:hypothetical protein
MILAEFLKALNKLPWLTALIILLSYGLYGWGLTVISAPLLYWAIALGIAAFLSMAVSYSFVALIPTTLAASVFVLTPLALDVVVIRGTEAFQTFANNFRHVFLFGVLAFVIALLWFSPLFWTHRVLQKLDLGRKQIIGVLTGCSWIGLGVGRLLGIWY